jgi:uncharacterized protein (DUF736 family)
MATNENSGALFKNNKRMHEKSPEYTGKAMVGGTEYLLSAWVNESKSGQKYFSIKFTLPQQEKRHEFETNDAAAKKMQQPDTDDLPF